MGNNASKWVLITIPLLILTGCSAMSAHLPAEVPPMHRVGESGDDQNDSRPRDPWKGFSRSNCQLGDEADCIFLPVVKW